MCAFLSKSKITIVYVAVLVIAATLGYVSANPCDCAKADAITVYVNCEYRGSNRCMNRLRNSFAAVDNSYNCTSSNGVMSDLEPFVSTECVNKISRKRCVKRFLRTAIPDYDSSSCCCDPLSEPSKFNNPFCIEGHACCPDGSWTCSIGDGRTFSCAGKSVINPTGDVCPVPSSRCCDPLLEPGQYGNPKGEEGHACCPDGTWGDSTGAATFYICNGVEIKNPNGTVCSTSPGVCTLDVKICPDGSSVGRDPNNNCEFFPCPAPGACTEDAKTCPDGSSVGRDPNNNCEFFPCPAGATRKPCCDPLLEPGKNGNPIGREGYACCSDGLWTTNNIGDGKTFVCGDVQVTNPDGAVCTTPPTGNSTEESPNQAFCPLYVIVCPDGSYVGPDPNKNCTIPPCPTTGSGCCQASQEPGKFDNPLCFDGYICCAKEEVWSCGIGDGSFPCGGEYLTNSTGKVCPQ